MTATDPTHRSARLGLAVALLCAGVALAGCNPATSTTASSTSTDASGNTVTTTTTTTVAAASGVQPVSAGTVLDDSVITTKVKAALVTGTDGRGLDTSVSTRKGEVLLSGFVDTRAEAERQGQLAQAVQGVTAVDNKLMVKDGKSTAGNKLDDSVVTVKVKSALLADEQTRAHQFAVTTNKGIVQLSGFVDSADEQARATTVARNVEGVQSVVNDTSIKK